MAGVSHIHKFMYECVYGSYLIDLVMDSPVARTMINGWCVAVSVAACCSVLQRIAVSVAACCSLLLSVAVYRSVLQCFSVSLCFCVP